MNENHDWVELTRFEFSSKKQIIPKFTYLLDQDGIKWKIKSKVIKYGDHREKKRFALLREPFEPVTAETQKPKTVPRCYTRGQQLIGVREEKLERAINEIITYKLNCK